MGTNVFANGNEVSCKASSGKSIAAFPDPCWSPPPPPAGPIVIPYPNTAEAKKLTNGSKSVSIKGTEIAMKDMSYIAKSMGNEAATQGFQKGVATSVIQGKAYYIAWSMDVKVEGAPVARHCDMMTHNHGSFPTNTGPFYYMSAPDDPEDKCKSTRDKVETECKPKPKNDSKTGDGAPPAKKQKTESTAPDEYNSSPQWLEHCPEPLREKATPDKHGASKKELDGLSKEDEEIKKSQASEKAKQKAIEQSDSISEEKNPCVNARRCVLTPYKRNTKSQAEKGKGCCPGQTGHHVLPDAMCRPPGATAKGSRDSKGARDCWSKYKEGEAPTICVEGVNNSWSTHGDMHNETQKVLQRNKCYEKDEGGGYKENSEMTYEKASELMSQVVKEVFPHCDKECIKQQLDNYYKENAYDKEKCNEKTANEAKVTVHSGKQHGHKPSVEGYEGPES